MGEKCKICEYELNSDDVVWITKHYPVCSECYNALTPEEIQSIIENYS